MAEIGHNLPPDMIDSAAEITASINRWLTDHPTVETEEDAREAKLMADRGKLCGKDLEDERDKKVRPLNEQVQQINAAYRQPREILRKVTDGVVRRLTDYIAKEEAKRIKIAEEARKRTEEAEKAAREAEQRERDAIADAEVGAVVSLSEAVSAADEAFAEYKRSEREANLAAREAHVKVGGGLTRAMSLRSVEVLSISNASAAIAAMGLTPDIVAAIIKGARAFREIHGELPAGIESRKERTA